MVTKEGGNMEESGSWRMMERRLESVSSTGEISSRITKNHLLEMAIRKKLKKTHELLLLQ